MRVYTDVHIPLIINAPAGILLRFRCVTPDVATVTPCCFVDYSKTLLQQSSPYSLPQPFSFSGHLTLKKGQESKREQERVFFFLRERCLQAAITAKTPIRVHLLRSTSWES